MSNGYWGYHLFCSFSMKIFTMKTLIGILLALSLSCQHSIKDQTFEIEAKPCLGRCPVYLLKIDAKGAYTIETPKNETALKGGLSKTQKRELKLLIKGLPQTDTLTYLGRANVYDIPEINVQYGNSKAIIKGRQFAPTPYKRIITWSDQFVKRHTD